MRLVPASVLATALTLALATSASAEVVVGGTSRDGTQGRVTVNGHSLDFGRATTSDVRHAEGRKPNSDSGVVGRRGPVGRVLTFRIRVSARRTCVHEYSFANAARRRLEDFHSTCPDTRTPRGTRVGMNVSAAEAREKLPAAYSPGLGHDCTFHAAGIAVPGTGPTYLVLWMNSLDPKARATTKVGSIDLFGPQAVAWLAACA